MKLRPLSGSSAICLVVTTPPAVVVPRETLLVSPVTVTCSVTPPIFISMSASKSLPIATTRLSRTTLVKPSSSPVTV